MKREKLICALINTAVKLNNEKAYAPVIFTHDKLQLTTEKKFILQVTK